MALLEIRDLHTFFRTKKGIVKAVNGVSYSVEPGRTLGIVGESGSGKSVAAMSILQLLDGNGYIDSGEIFFDGRDLTKCTKEEMYKVRGNDISVIFQEPMTSHTPTQAPTAAPTLTAAPTDMPAPIETAADQAAGGWTAAVIIGVLLLLAAALSGVLVHRIRTRRR